jgi:hypothetical protein
MELGQRELADAIDRDEQIELSFLGPDLSQIHVDVPDRIRLELLAGSSALDTRQPAHRVALEEPME